jgi:prepilin-type N-terminal cleavage/methylation domain-containing protein
MTCNIKTKNVKCQGFTLPEVLVSMLVFGLLFLALSTSLTLGIRYFRKAEAANSAFNTCAAAFELIHSDTNQGVPNEDPGGSGYIGIIPAVDTTAFLMPNKNVKTSDQLIFNIANHTLLDVLAAAPPVDRRRPDIYRQVRYYTDSSNKILYRVMSNITATGSLVDETPMIIAEAGSSGAIILKAEYVSSRSIKVTLTVKEDVGMVSESEYTAIAILSSLAE